MNGKIIGKKIRLRDKKLADAVNDYAWQTDPELAELDAAEPLSTGFIQYFAEYASELRYPALVRCQFALETLDGKHIGNCAYYNIDETAREAELGIMIGTRDYWDKGYGADAVTTLVNHIFHQTKLKRIHLKTIEQNYRAQKCFQRCGFTPCGHSSKNGFSFLLMEITRKQWQEGQVNCSKLAAKEANCTLQIDLTATPLKRIIKTKFDEA